MPTLDTIKKGLVTPGSIKKGLLGLGGGGGGGGGSVVGLVTDVGSPINSNSDTVDYRGTDFQVTEELVCQGGRAWGNSNQVSQGVNYEIALWNVDTQTLLASKSYTPEAAAWVESLWDSPVTLEVGVTYSIGIFYLGVLHFVTYGPSPSLGSQVYDPRLSPGLRRWGNVASVNTFPSSTQSDIDSMDGIADVLVSV